MTMLMNVFAVVRNYAYFIHLHKGEALEIYADPFHRFSACGLVHLASRPRFDNLGSENLNDLRLSVYSANDDCSIAPTALQQLDDHNLRRLDKGSTSRDSCIRGRRPPQSLSRSVLFKKQKIALVLPTLLGLAAPRKLLSRYHRWGAQAMTQFLLQLP